MKTIIQINGKSVEIELTDDQVQAIRNAKSSEFDIKYNKSAVFFTYGGYLNPLSKGHGSINFGDVRATPTLARIAYKNSKARNKLEELVHWLEPDWQPDWGNENQGKSHIYYDSREQQFSFSTYFNKLTYGTVYMSEETADKICTALNDGKLPELEEILKQ